MYLQLQKRQNITLKLKGRLARFVGAVILSEHRLHPQKMVRLLFGLAAILVDMCGWKIID